MLTVSTRARCPEATDEGPPRQDETSNVVDASSQASQLLQTDKVLLESIVNVLRERRHELSLNACQDPVPFYPLSRSRSK